MMNASPSSFREMAEEAVSVYRSTVDASLPHARNVQLHLRAPVLLLTQRILHPVIPQIIELDLSQSMSHNAPMKQQQQQQQQQRTNKQQDWRDYLRRHEQTTTTTTTTTVVSSSETNLGRRGMARLEAFLEGCALAVPDDPFSPSNATTKPMSRRDKTRRPTEGTGGGIGKLVANAHEQVTALYKRTIPSTSLISSSSSLDGVQVSQRNHHHRSLPNKTKNPVYPQIAGADLVVRLELYARSLGRLWDARCENAQHRSRCVEFEGKIMCDDHCVVALEPPRAIKARVHYTIQSFVATVGCVRSIAPNLTKLVTQLTKELLAVQILGNDLVRSIQRLVSEYEHMTSFASLAFLSSPDQSAVEHLTPLLSAYLEYLQDDWKSLVARCEMEQMLNRALDAEMRKTLTTMEFQSIGHLLHVCHEYRQELQSIAVPPSQEEEGILGLCGDVKALKQALKDLRREVITVNGHILPPAHSMKELARLLEQTLNSRTLTLHAKHKKKARRRLTKGRSVLRRADSCPSSVAAAASSALHSDDSSSDINMSNSSSSGSEMDSDSNPLAIPSSTSSGCEGDTDGSHSITDTRHEDGNTNHEEVRPRITRRPSFDVETIDFMTRRLLIAAARTGMGGDAYFVVRDLFGGDEVEVVPSSQGSRRGDGHDGRMLRKVGGGTIELVVRLASVSIKCHGTFDVYPKPLVDDADGCEPLIQLHTCTSETIFFQMVRTSHGDNDNANDMHLDPLDTAITPGGTMLMLTEKETELTGWRNLSIRPAHYEQVDVFVTPS